MWPRIDGLRTLGLGAPGDFRAELNTLVLAGTKRATAGLLTDYRKESEELEQIGERLALIDNLGTRVAEVEVTAVEVTLFSQVTWEFAEAEGEGFRSIEHWRAGYARYWAAEGTEVDDRTPVVCLWFRLVVDEPGTA